MPTQRADEETYDLVIVGGGVAGWTAARRSQQLGLRAIVLEKHTAGPGFGNGRLSGGHFHAAYRTPRLPAEVLHEELVQRTLGHARQELMRAWADNVIRGLNFLIAEGGNFAPASDLEYQENVLFPMRGSSLGRDWRNKGPDNLLTDMWQRYMQNGGAFRPGRRARELVVDNGVVVGVVADASGNDEIYRATAVVLCDGGFQGNPDLVARYITPSYALRGSPSDTGDALQMGLAIGAKAVNMEWFYGHVMGRDALVNNDLWPALSVGGLARHGIYVDGNGKRFTDEGLGDEINADRICKSDTPGGCWVIFDNEVWFNRATRGEFPINPTIIEHGGATVLSAYSVAELADQAGIPADALVDTIESYNAFIEFGKELAVPRTDPGKPIARYPIHAIPAIAGITFAMGGLLVNKHGQVLNEQESVIEGLYAAGGSMGGLQGGPGFGYAGGWSEAATFGLLSVEHIASATS